jgi:group I intron endonuclease
MFYVYVIRNLINGKEYVGITNNPDRRWREHKSGHGSKVLSAALLKYGTDKFTFDVVHCVYEETRVHRLEEEEIATRGSQAPGGYNLSAGGEFSAYGMRHSDDTKKQMSLTRSGSGNAMYGRKHSDHTRQLQSDKAKQRDNSYLQGKNNPMYGRVGGSNPNAKRITVDDIEYSSITDAATANGCSTSAIKARVVRGARPHGCSKKIVIDGIEYASIKMAAEALGVTAQSLYRHRSDTLSGRAQLT